MYIVKKKYALEVYESNCKNMYETEEAGREKWVSVGAERQKAAKEKRRRQKERTASLPSPSQTFVCPKCGRRCASRIGLYSHQRACKN